MEAIKFTSEPEEAPKRGGAGKFFVVLLILAAAIAGFFYWWHFKHNQLPVTASAAVPAIQQPAPTAPKPVVETPLPAKRIPLQPMVAPSVQKPVVLTPEQKRLRVAQDGFDNTMAMAVGHPDAFGFQYDESLGAAKLGKEIPLYTIKLLGKDKSLNQQVSSLLQPANEWLFPVILGNHVRYLVKVQFDGHDYVLGEGSRSLGMSYDKILAQWPASKGFHPKLITVPNLPAYYFTIPELPNSNITDTERMLDYTPSLSPASIVLANCQ